MIFLGLGVALLAVVLLVVRCVPQDTAKIAAQTRQASQERVIARQLRAACASQATYDRLKQAAFAEAIRIRNADPVNLATLATYSTVRMEQPRVKSRDETLDTTVCTGRLILDIPPGAERAFDGARRLEADVEYSAQAAADGSGPVYQLRGAEPIVTRLAGFDLQVQAYRPSAVTTLPSLPAREVDQAPVEDFDNRASEPAPIPSQPEIRPVTVPRAPVVGPSFDCRRARTSSERMVCADGRLAALDRDMASLYNAVADQGGRRTREDLRDSRDRFLRFREGCRSASCVAQAYRDRMDEIRDIADR